MHDDLRPSNAIESQFLHALSRLGETRHWEPGAVVVSEGDPADCMYIIHEGQLRAVVSGEGGRAVELNTLGPGEFFGELMLDGQKRAATVQAVTRVFLTRITRDEAMHLLQTRPDLAFLLIQRLIDRVRTLTRTVGNLGAKDVYQRLVGLLQALATEEGGRRVVPPMSQQRIAERVGASRAMVNRLLQDLTKGGYIALQRGAIVLLKPLPPRW